MAPRPQHDWPAIRLAYETSSESVTVFSRRLGVSRQSVAKRAEAEGWVRPLGAGPAVADVPAMVEALQRTAGRLVAIMEVRVGTSGEGIDEKEVRALGTLAGTLAKIIALDPAGRSARDGRPDDQLAEPGTDRERFEELVALAERFVATRAPEELPGSPDAGDAGLDLPPLADGGAD